MNLRDIFKPVRFATEIDVALKYFAEAIARDEVDFNPSYQRGHRWTQTQKQEFLGHLLTGGEILPLIIQRVPDSGKGEMLDGKQRATAILEWLDNKVGAAVGGALLFRRDVDTSSLNLVSMRVRYINLPWEERKAFYVKFNSGGAPHTPEELAAALTATERR